VEITYKILGQSTPVLNTDSTVYAVPTGKEAVISTLTIVNRASSTAATYRVSVAPLADIPGTKHFIAYDLPVAALTTINLTFGLTVSSQDRVIVSSSTGDVSFNVFGMEITPA
jgi:hypothetical protein